MYIQQLITLYYIVQYDIIYCKAIKIMYFYLVINGQQYIDNTILTIQY